MFTKAPWLHAELSEVTWLFSSAQIRDSREEKRPGGHVQVLQPATGLGARRPRGPETEHGMDTAEATSCLSPLMELPDCPSSEPSPVNRSGPLKL